MSLPSSSAANQLAATALIRDPISPSSSATGITISTANSIPSSSVVLTTAIPADIIRDPAPSSLLDLSYTSSFISTTVLNNQASSFAQSPSDPSSTPGVVSSHPASGDVSPSPSPTDSTASILAEDLHTSRTQLANCTTASFSGTCHVLLADND